MTLRTAIRNEYKNDYNSKTKNLVLLAKDRKHTCLFTRNDKWRMRWDLVIIVLAVYNCFLVPH